MTVESVILHWLESGTVRNSWENLYLELYVLWLLQVGVVQVLQNQSALSQNMTSSQKLFLISSLLTFEDVSFVVLGFHNQTVTGWEIYV